MPVDAIVRRQLTARLKRLRQRAIAIAAEIELAERLLVDLERQSAVFPQVLRKNSAAKFSVQSNVRRILDKSGSPLQAEQIYKKLLEIDPALKSSTFRSYMRRMVASEILVKKGKRGSYDLAIRIPPEPRDVFPSSRRRALLDFND